MKNNEVEQILKKYDLSIRKLADLLDVNPSSIVNWKEEAKETSSKNKEKLSLLDRTIGNIMHKTGIGSKEVVDLILALKRASLWSGHEYNTLKSGFFSKNFENEIIDALKKEYSDSKPIELEANHPAANRTDYLFTDKEGNVFMVEIFMSKPAQRSLSSILNIQKQLKELLKISNITTIVVAGSFDDEFVSIAKEIPSIILKQYRLKATLKDI